MRTHGFNPTEEDLKDMIRNVDTNSNGAIDFNEFIEMMLRRDSKVEEDVVHAFRCSHILILFPFQAPRQRQLKKKWAV